MSIKYQAINFFGKFNSLSAKVLFYHDIHKNNKYTYDSTSLELFNQQILKIKSLGYDFTNKLPQKSNEVLICFDDGYKGIYECKDYIIENKIPVKIFLVTNKINEPNYLSVKQIVELNNTGLFDFESHTHNHVDVGKTKDKNLILSEVIESTEFLSQLLGKNVDELCLPHGSFSNFALKIICETRIKNVFTCLPGKAVVKYRNINLISRSLVQNTEVENIEGVMRSGDSFLRYYYFIKQKNFA